jgi:hypothetical protein
MSDNRTPFEREMARKNNSVVTIKNIDNEDFSHSYDGYSYMIRAGEILPFPYPVAMLLAKHLAMKFARKEAQKDSNFKSNVDKKSINLYTEKALGKYLSQIIIHSEDKPLPQAKSEGEILKEKTEDLQKNFKKEIGENPRVPKKDVMEELRKRNIKFDPKASINDLLAILTKAEMEGNTGNDDEDEEVDE